MVIRNLLRSLSFIVVAILLLLAIGAVTQGTRLGLKDDITGALAGALIGGAGVLLGVMLDRLARLQDEAERREKLAALIAAELGTGLLNRLQAHRFFAQSIRAMQVGAGAGLIDLSPYAPRPMPVSTHLGSEFLILSVRQIDVLTTLTSSLAMSGEQLSGIGTMARPLGMLEATMLRDVARHELELVAQAFEVFAPQRKIALPGAEPILASALARSEAHKATG